jgi:rare lipoprotein A (peptidoglycan hydrolase)
MGFHPLSPQNWNRMFNIWIDDIQVRFKPVTSMAMDGGLLRRIRSATRISAALVILFFSLHCTKPAITVSKPGKPLGSQPGEPDQGYTETGEASWYGGESDGFEGKPTANGEVMDSTKLSCAHRTLPLGSYVEVRNLGNDRKTILRINDRGPFLKGRILDVSRQAAKDLGFLEEGKANVKIRAVEKDGSPSRMTPVDLTNPFTIQVAALADPANIERLSRDLEASIGPVTLQNTTTKDGRVVKRIRVGVYVTMEAAQQGAELVVKRFGDRGVEPFITRRY